MKNNSGSFNQFLFALCLSSFSMGVHSLLFPWLIVGQLGAEPGSVGFAMMLIMLPSSFLLLWGGAYSDGRHLGNLLLRLNSLFIVPYFFLIIFSYGFGWSYELVLLFGLSFGIINAFVQPARESLLGAVASPPLQKAVAKAMIAQSIGMGSGALAGGFIIEISLAAAVIMQIVLFVCAGLMMRRCSPGINKEKKRKKTSLQDIVSGLSFALHSSLLRGLLLMCGVTGFLGFGFYFVMLPLMTREVYQGGASFLAGLQAVFLLGGVFVSFVVVRWFGTFRRPGRILIIITLLRGILLMFISLRLPVGLVFAGIFLWGVLSSFSAIVGRTMIQEFNSDEYRSRLISIYQLSLFGTGPPGALIGGLLIDQLGILMTTAVLGICTIGIGAICIVLKIELWQTSNHLAKSN